MSKRIFLIVIFFFFYIAKGDFIDQVLNNSVDVQRKKALYAARQGNYSKALELINEAIKEESRDKNLIRCDKLAILSMAGKYKTALDLYLNKISKGYHFSASTRQILGKIMYHNKRYREAISFLEDNTGSDKGLEDMLVSSYVASDQLNKALELAKSVAAKNHVMYLYGVFLARKGKYIEAEKVLRKAWNDGGKPLPILYDRIVNFAWAGKNKAALNLYKLVPAKADIPEYAGVEIARSLRKEKHYQESNKMLQRYMASAARNPAVRQLFFANLLSMNKLSDAKNFIKKYSEDQKQMTADLQRAMHDEGVRLARTGKYNQANAMLENALKLKGSAKETAEIEYDRLTTAAWAGKYNQADKIFDDIKNKKDVPYYARIEAARSFFAMGNTAQAEKLAKEALAQNKNSKAALEILVKCYIKNQDYEKALSILDRDSKLKPDYLPQVVKIMQDKASKLGREGDYKASLKLLDHAIKLSGNSTNVIGDKVAVLSWAGKHQQAVDAFEKLSPEQRLKLPPFVLSTVAGSYRQLSKSSDALKYYSKVLKKDPSNTDAARALASLLAYSGAEKELSKFIAKRTAAHPEEKETLHKEMAAGLRNFAVMTARRGNTERALAVLRQLLKEFPDDQQVRCDYATILAWNRQFKKSIDVFNGLSEGYNAPVYVLDAIAGAYRSSGAYMKAADIYDQILKREPDNLDALRGAVRSRIEAGHEKEALALIEQQNRLMGSEDAEYTALLGYAYYEAGQIAKAEKTYLVALKQNPHSLEVLDGLATIMSKQKKWKQAIKYAKMAVKIKPDAIPALYILAEAKEAVDDLTGAYECYDRISKLPGGGAAINAKYRLLSSLGATGLALDMLKKSRKKVSRPVYEKLLADHASIAVQQRDTSRAQKLLKHNLYDAEKFGSRALRLRSSYDSIIAQSQIRSMRQIVAEYEKMLTTGEKTPYWVDTLAAEAYIYLRQPEKALHVYQIAEEKERAGKVEGNDWTELQLSMYYCYVELGDYKKAGKILEQLEKKIPPYTWQRKPNWSRLSVEIEWAWWLMFQDRLAEAEAYLQKLLDAAPGSEEILNAEAYLHYYRGWPRRAEKDFRMLVNMYPNDRSARIGLCYTMNENDQWRKARKEADRLQKKYPTDQGVAKLQRSLELETMRTEAIYFNSSLSSMVSDGFSLSQRFNQPIFPNRSVYVESTWKYIKKGELDNDELPDTLNVFRNEVGVNWRIYRDLTLSGGFSLDYKAEHPGGTAGFKFTPDDHISIYGEYESYSLNAPGAILLDDGWAQRYSVGVDYRQSEDFNSSVGFSQMFVSDKNMVTEISARQDKAITTGAYWKTRLAFTQSLSLNSSQDVDYYAPTYNVMLNIIPSVEHVWYRHYETSVVDRLSIAPGLQIEAEYAPNFAGYIRYELEWALNDIVSFQAGATGSLRNYDGECTDGLSFDASIIFRF